MSGRENFVAAGDGEVVIGREGSPPQILQVPL